jgi:Uma2 family endonuclease
MQQWIDNGAKLAWLIDPIDRAVSIYRPHHEVESHQNPTSIHADGIMSGFSLIMSRLWGS